MRLPRLTTRRLMVLVVAVALLLCAERLRRLSIKYEEKARWCDHEATEMTNCGFGSASTINRYRSLRDKYEHAVHYPWLPVPPDPPPPG